jgi:cellulose 1,4-beta-cellobiosidase
MTRSTLPILAVLALAAARPAAAVVNCEPFGTVNVSGKAYVVQNNRWNPAATGQQCIDVNETTGAFTVSTANNSVPTNGAPASYPAIFKGCHWGNCTNNSGLPLQVSNIGTASSSWNVTMAAGTYNVAYDLWFNTTPTTTGQPNGTELMIWIGSQGSIQPIGSQVGTVTLAGATWQVWIGNSGWNVISFRRTSNATSVNLDLKPFINEAVARGQLQRSWYFIAAEAGFELWQGGAGVRSNSFSFSASPGGNPQPTPTPGPTPTPVPTPGPTPSPGGGLTTQVVVTNDFGTGYCADLRVRNGGTAAVEWVVTFTIQGRIYNIWNATHTQSGSSVTARGVSWNRILQPGQTTSGVGFCANR